MIITPEQLKKEQDKVINYVLLRFGRRFAPFQEEISRCIVRAFLWQDIPEIFIEVARQAGKTTAVVDTLSVISSVALPEWQKEGIIGVFAPQKEQTKTDFDRTKDNLTALAKAGDVEAKYLEANANTIVTEGGGTYYAFTLQKGANIEGKSNNIQVFEESQKIYGDMEKKMKVEAWPMGAAHNAPRIFIGSGGYQLCYFYKGIQENLGKQVADYYNKVAKDLNAKWHTSVPKEWDLAFLPIDSEEGLAYIREMNYCVDFALANRKLMMDRICNEFYKNIYDAVDNIECSFDPMINIAHNYAKQENFFGQNVWVHRKGATLASTDTVGIIPGSMGTKSYIVRGLGNADSFNSCSHGAGRKLGRKAACEKLNFAEQTKLMDDQGIIHGMRHKDDLEEAPGAYKDIDEVMENQKDLVEILVELKPLAVIKG